MKMDGEAISKMYANNGGENKTNDYIYCCVCGMELVGNFIGYGVSVGHGICHFCYSTCAHGI